MKQNALIIESEIISQRNIGSSISEASLVIPDEHKLTSNDGHNEEYKESHMTPESERSCPQDENDDAPTILVIDD